MRARTIRRWAAAALLIGGISATDAAARAAVPPTLTTQGRLFNANDNVIQGSLTVVFSLYDAPDATVPIWTEQDTVVFDQG